MAWGEGWEKQIKLVWFDFVKWSALISYAQILNFTLLIDFGSKISPLIDTERTTASHHRWIEIRNSWSFQTYAQLCWQIEYETDFRRFRPRKFNLPRRIDGRGCLPISSHNLRQLILKMLEDVLHIRQQKDKKDTLFKDCPATRQIHKPKDVKLY